MLVDHIAYTTVSPFDRHIPYLVNFILFFPAEQLLIKDIELHKDENRRAHHTDKYEHSNLIVRRGQSFDVTLTFNRAYEAFKDTIILQFVVGRRKFKNIFF